MIKNRRTVILGIIALWLGLVLTLATYHNSAAFSGGASGYSVPDTGSSCAGCHSGGAAPTVGASGPTSVAPNSTTSYVLSIQSNMPISQTHAGFNVVMRDGSNNAVGTLATAEMEAQIVSGQLTHNTPNINDGSGLTDIAFTWTAPAATGTYTMHMSGNSVNRNFNPSGDAFAYNTLVVTVSEAANVSMSDIHTTQTSQPYLIALVAGLLAVPSISLLRRKRID